MRDLHPELIDWLVGMHLDRQGNWQKVWFKTVDVYPSPLGHVWIFYRDSSYGFAHWLNQETIGM
jgi:hypothetical protein